MPRRRGQGEGSLEELPSGKWRAIYTSGKKPDGSQRKVTATFDTRKEANFWLQEQLEAMRQGRSLVPTRMLTEDWLKHWLKSLKTRLSGNTWRSCESLVRTILIPQWGDAELGQLSPLLIDQGLIQLAESGTSPDRQRKALKLLRQSLKQAVKMKLIYANPAGEVSNPKAAVNEMLCWTKEEAQKFLASVANHKLYTLYALALDSGMRQGELLGLHWSDVDLAAGIVTVRQSLEYVKGKYTLKQPKTAAGKRRIWIGFPTVTALRAHCHDMRHLRRNVATGPIFLNRNGHWLKAEKMPRALDRAIKKAGVPRIRFHDLRHTNATLLLQAGVGIKTVSQRLGHANVAITLRTYTHVLPGEQEAVAKVSGELFGPVSHSHPT